VAFSILAVRDGEAPDDPNYPFPGETPDTVELTEADGEAFGPFQAHELTVGELTGGNIRNLLRVRKVKANLIVTESRVAVACSKYEKGGGFTPFGGVGALAVAGVANTVSKVRAARRRRGKMLVGHVPYTRLVSVGFRPPSGLKGKDWLRLTMFDPTIEGQRFMVLDAQLAPGCGAARRAKDIAKLAAGHQLGASNAPVEPDRRAVLEGLLDPPELTAKPKAFASYMLLADGASPTPSEA
jgi:hypothetical protein